MNIPNLLTLIRFLLIPAFIYYFFSDSEYNIHISTFIFLLAGATDMLDGFIARRYNQVTRTGIVLDPLADKLMLITVLISVTIRYDIPVWIIAIVCLKELLMISGAVALYNVHNIVVPANVFGKLATVLSYAAVLAVTFNLSFSNILLYAFIAATVFALSVYLAKFIGIRKRHTIIPRNDDRFSVKNEVDNP
ncbi:MAG: CDP-alcohol phosphatidyltransferase family protein [Bacillota bacterium]